jgi:hypothetical protein
METTIHIDEGTILLFCYGKAIDLWIAEQGKDCLEENTSESIPLIAESLLEDFWHIHKKLIS